MHAELGLTFGHDEIDGRGPLASWNVPSTTILESFAYYMIQNLKVSAVTLAHSNLVFESSCGYLKFSTSIYGIGLRSHHT